MKFNPEYSLRTARGVKGVRQKFIVTHNPSEIDQNQLLLFRFPNFGSDDVIFPRTANLSFAIKRLNQKREMQTRHHLRQRLYRKLYVIEHRFVR